MQSTDKCWTQPRAALVIAMIFLTACARVGSETAPGGCQPLVEYSRTEQLSMAEELADYAVLRDQARLVVPLGQAT